jgi:hypothetical protein
MPSNADATRKPGLVAFILDCQPTAVLVFPAVYSLLLPFFLLDIWVTLFQWIFFPMIGIPKVRRRDYLVLDRHKLTYLNVLEKAHCTYCAYANGLVSYVREIGARIEQHACPIKHRKPAVGVHHRYQKFVEFGDAEGYRRRLVELRRDVTSDLRRSETEKGPSET